MMSKERFELINFFNTRKIPIWLFSKFDDGKEYQVFLYDFLSKMREVEDKSNSTMYFVWSGRINGYECEEIHIAAKAFLRSIGPMFVNEGNIPLIQGEDVSFYLIRTGNYMKLSSFKIFSKEGRKEGGR